MEIESIDNIIQFSFSFSNTKCTYTNRISFANCMIISVKTSNTPFPCSDLIKCKKKINIFMSSPQQKHRLYYTKAPLQCPTYDAICDSFLLYEAVCSQLFKYFVTCELQSHHHQTEIVMNFRSIISLMYINPSISDVYKMRTIYTEMIAGDCEPRRACTITH